MDAKNTRPGVVDTWSGCQAFRQFRDGGLRAMDTRAAGKRRIAHDTPGGPAADLTVLA
ncbi:hypothetical protein [uncultured Amaricoccus sp.]|uniref:hypothetical protein n=1 Tax=uncultured Amaricoccus sp. TaxID=339341 RepID=UPI0026111545|nr:hypothetical protein [uncultured Amaricoccus sp.]